MYLNLEPEPLEAEELLPAMCAIEHVLSLAPEGEEQTDSDRGFILTLLASWNALERHLAYIEERPWKNIHGETVTVIDGI